MFPVLAFVEETMKAHALHLPHFHGFHLRLPRLAFSWSKMEGVFEVFLELALILLGVVLALWLFTPGVNA